MRGSGSLDNEPKIDNRQLVTVNRLITRDTLSGKTKKYKDRNLIVLVAEEKSFGGQLISATPRTPGALVDVVIDNQFVLSLGIVNRKNMVGVGEVVT
jgi:hypothetical protein